MYYLNISDRGGPTSFVKMLRDDVVYIVVRYFGSFRPTLHTPCKPKCLVILCTPYPGAPTASTRLILRMNISPLADPGRSILTSGGFCGQTALRALLSGQQILVTIYEIETRASPKIFVDLPASPRFSTQGAANENATTKRTISVALKTGPRRRTAWRPLRT